MGATWFPMEPRAISRSLGIVVRQLRLEKGLSQEELAFSCGLHRTYIGSVERGERNLSLENIVRIAEALDATAAELLKSAEL